MIKLRSEVKPQETDETVYQLGRVLANVIIAGHRRGGWIRWEYLIQGHVAWKR